MNQQAKFNMINEKTLVVGIDIAKRKHWARCHNFRGESVSKPFPFQNNKFGFQSLVQKLENYRKKMGFLNIVIGVEPTGHYWKCLAYALLTTKISLVLVNPAHVKRTKELDDNSPTKNDPKDAGVIAKLVKDARFLAPQLPTGIYAELRNLINFREQLVKKMTRTKLQLHTLLDTYFPEFFTVFKKIDSKTALIVIREFPIPSEIVKLTVEEIKSRLKQNVKSSCITDILIQKLKKTANNSIGVKEGRESCKLGFKILVNEYTFLQEQLKDVEKQVSELLVQIDYAPRLLAIKGLGEISLATLLAETGDLGNYKHWKQLRKLAGLNLVERSSGDKKSAFKISKRGRRRLRAILYLIGLSLVSSNKEFKQIHYDFKNRKVKPLAGNQSVIAVISKFLRVVQSLVKNSCEYDPNRLIRSSIDKAA